MNFLRSRSSAWAMVAASTAATSTLWNLRQNNSSSCSAPSSPREATVSVPVTVEKWLNVTVLFKNKPQFDQKLERIALGGKKKLQVIADFDFTMTQFLNEQRQRSFSCHSLIEGNQYVSDDYRKVATGLLHYYYPIEVSTSLSVEQKVPLMVEWVEKAHDLMVATSGLRQSMIKLAVSEALEAKQITLRPGVPAFLATLDHHEIPILIFSAGLGDVIQELLSQRCHGLTPHLHIVSNHMIFRDDHLVGFTSPSYHVYNKTARSALSAPFFQRHDLKHRTSLILLGDSLGDISMSEGLSFDESASLKIGFLNEKPERLPDYLAVYDVVILGDPGYEIPNAILGQVLSEQ